MASDENKRIARVLMDDLFCDTAYQFYEPDYSFRHMIDYGVAPIRGAGKGAVSPKDRLTTIEQNRMTGEALRAVYPDGNTRALKSITAEGGRVVCEYLTHGGRNIFQRGREHNFHSVKVFDFNDASKVVAVREYTDTAYLVSFGPQIAEFTKAFLSGQVSKDAGEYSAWGASWRFRTPRMDLDPALGAAADSECEANKALVRHLIENWGRLPMLEGLTDAVMFSNEVDLDNTPLLGKSLHGKDELMAAARREQDVFPGGLTREISTVTAEENRVVVEAVLRGVSRVRPDREFTTHVLTIFFVRHGKVFRIRQYLDSAYWQNYSPDLVAYLSGDRSELPA